MAEKKTENANKTKKKKIEKRKKPLTQKSSIMLQEAVKFLFFRYNTLTAKDVQNKLDLRPQATYDYLNRLVTEGTLKKEKDYLKNHDRIKTTYYSLAKPRNKPDSLSMYPKDNFEKLSGKETREKINSMIHASIGALLETKIYIDSLNDSEVKEYLLNKTDSVGPYIDMLGMGENEFKILGEKLDKLHSDHWNEWKDYKEDSEEYLLILGVLKPLRYKEKY